MSNDMSLFTKLYPATCASVQRLAIVVRCSVLALHAAVIVTALSGWSVLAQQTTPTLRPVNNQVQIAKVAFPIDKLRQHPVQDIVAGLGNERRRIALLKFHENGNVEKLPTIEIPSGEVHDMRFGEDGRYLYAVGTSTDSRFKKSFLKTIVDLTRSPTDLNAIKKGAIYRIDTQNNNMRVRRLSEDFVNAKIHVSGNSIVVSDEVSSILLRFEADNIFPSELSDEKILLSDPEKNIFLGSSGIDFISANSTQIAGTPLYSNADNTVYMLSNEGDISRVMQLSRGTKSASFHFMVTAGQFVSLTFASKASLSIYDGATGGKRREISQRLTLNLDTLLHDGQTFLQQREEVPKGSALLDVSQRTDMIAIASRFSRNLLVYRIIPNAIERMNLVNLKREPHSILLSNDGQFLLVTHKDTPEITVIRQLRRWLPDTAAFAGNVDIREAQNVIARESLVKGHSKFFIIDGFFGSDTEKAFRELATEKEVSMPARLSSFQDQVKAARAIANWASGGDAIAANTQQTVQPKDIDETAGCELGTSKFYMDIESMAELEKRGKAPLSVFCPSGDEEFPIKVDVVEVDIRNETAERLKTRHITCEFFKSSYPTVKVDLCR